MVFHLEIVVPALLELAALVDVHGDEVGLNVLGDGVSQSIESDVGVDQAGVITVKLVSAHDPIRLLLYGDIGGATTIEADDRVAVSADELVHRCDPTI